MQPAALHTNHLPFTIRHCFRAIPQATLGNLTLTSPSLELKSYHEGINAHLEQEGHLSLNGYPAIDSLKRFVRC